MTCHSKTHTYIVGINYESPDEDKGHFDIQRKVTTGVRQVVTSKTVYLCHILSYRKSKKRAIKKPLSHREKGALVE